MTSGSSTANQELDSLLKHKVKSLQVRKIISALHLQATILLLVLPLPQFVLPHVLVSMQVLLNSPQEADTRVVY